VGEVHSFEGLTGSVSPDGAVSVEIDLTSLETNIDIRNERMLEHVFKGIATASLSAEIDMSEAEGLAVGDSTVIDVEGVLSLIGTEVEVETEMFMARLSDTQVMVTTNDLIFLNAEDAGINAGISKLMELASLPGITRTSPVVMRLIFNASEQKAQAAPAAATVQIAGDVGAGKKVFKKCKACHKVKEGRNGAGPSLFNIVGQAAGKVDGFRFSKAMASSDLVWDAATLTAFLEDPKGFLPGTKMAFRGLKKPEEIENVIAYMADQTDK
jgi:cytochrome c2